MNIKIYLLSFILSSLILAGCQDSTSPLAEEELDASTHTTEFSAHLLTPNAFSGEELSKEERTLITEHSVPDQVRMAELIQEATSWEDAHVAMQELLSEPSELPDYIREQRAAVFMLKASRSLGTLSNEHREGIAFYTELLAKYRSPEATLLLESLLKLEGYWTESKIRYIASRGVEGADTFLDKKYYCDECPAGKAKVSAEGTIAETRDAFVNELLGSVEALRLLTHYSE